MGEKPPDPALLRVTATLKPIRDGLGGHVRPTNATKKIVAGDPVPDAIRAHGDEGCAVEIDIKSGKNTSLQGISAHALLFVWPEAKTVEGYVAKIHETFDQLDKSVIRIVHGIDMLMYFHWLRLGIIKR